MAAAAPSACQMSAFVRAFTAARETEKTASQGTSACGGGAHDANPGASTGTSKPAPRSSSASSDRSTADGGGPPLTPGVAAAVQSASAAARKVDVSTAGFGAANPDAVAAADTWLYELEAPRPPVACAGIGCSAPPPPPARLAARALTAAANADVAPADTAVGAGA